MTVVGVGHAVMIAIAVRLGTIPATRDVIITVRAVFPAVVDPMVAGALGHPPARRPDVAAAVMAIIAWSPNVARARGRGDLVDRRRGRRADRDVQVGLRRRRR